MLQITIIHINPATSQEVFKKSPKPSQFGINYRSSSIVVDDGLDRDSEMARAYPRYADDSPTAVCAGDRAPDASGLVKIGGGAASEEQQEGTSSLTPYALPTTCSPGTPKVCVIIPAGNIPPASAFIHPVDVYEDRDGYAAQFYRDIDGSGKVFIIRPDAHVGGGLSDLDKLEGYFNSIFGDYV